MKNKKNIVISDECFNSDHWKCLSLICQYHILKRPINIYPKNKLLKNLTLPKVTLKNFWMRHCHINSGTLSGPTIEIREFLSTKINQTLFL